MDKKQDANVEMNPPGPQCPRPARSDAYVLPSGQPVAGNPPPAGYTAIYYAGAPLPSASQQQQQQPQSVVILSGQQPAVEVQHVQSFVGHIIFACVIFWCVDCLFGLIAFILAVVASRTAVENPSHARRLGQASLGVSSAGIIVSIIVVAITLGVIFGTAASTSSVPNYCGYYTYLGTCYRYKEQVGEYGYCSGVKSSSYDCYSDNTYCPYYTYLGTCYKYRRIEFSLFSCAGVYDSFSNYCYYS